MVWLIPALALLKACCEQWMVCEIGFPIFLRKSEKNSSSKEEVERLTLLRSSSIIVQKGSLPQFRRLKRKIERLLPSLPERVGENI